MRPLATLDQGSFHGVSKPSSRTVASSLPAIQRTVTCFPTMLRCHLRVAPPKRNHSLRATQRLAAQRGEASLLRLAQSLLFSNQFACVSSAYLR